MRPNILFITTHDLGKHVPIYGLQTVVAPAIEHLAQRGIVFDQSFCTAPQCSPSRAALHTGRHAHTVGMLGLGHEPFNWRLHPNELHLAHRLGAVGYETALFGIQHLTEGPFQLLNPAELGYETAAPALPASDMAEEVVAFLAARAETDRPFYLEVGFFEPHRPYDWGGARPDDSRGVTVPPYIPDSPAAQQDFAALQGMVRVMDTGVDAILQALNAHGLEQNTWVIFTTDHGIAMPRAKCTLYDPGIETTLVMHWPGGGLTGGRRISEMISHVDMVPTLLEGLGLPVPDNLHGRSYWPLLCGEAYDPRSHVFAEKTYHTMYEPMRAIRTDRHKLIVNFAEDVAINVPADIQLSPIFPTMLDQITPQRPFVELYDLRHDPHEMHNIAGQPETAELEASLKRQLLHWMERTADPLLTGVPVSPHHHEVIRQMRRAGSSATDDTKPGEPAIPGR